MADDTPFAAKDYNDVKQLVDAKIQYRRNKQRIYLVSREGEKHRSILDIADVKTVKVNHDLRELYDNGQLTIEEVNAVKVPMEGR